MSRQVQSLERGLSVLEGVLKGGPIGVTDLAAQLELDKTIVHRLLNTLQTIGYISQDTNRKYIVGPRLRMVSAKTLSTLNMRALALPYMVQLAEYTKGVAHLAKMAESRAIYIERVHHPMLPVTSTDVGGQAPGYCSAAGKVLWAYLPQLELNDLLDQVEFRSHTVNTISDRPALQRQLAQVREQGYAVDMEEHRLGLVGIGAPVLDHTGSVIASICVACLSSRSDEMVLAGIRDQVLEASRNLSAEMGFSNGTF
ncbi:MAG: IclR family transcriptional regulator [Chloroflexota bacterium]|nr:IclR family transcriptional regulator [Anaerolineae bacterium]